MIPAFEVIDAQASHIAPLCADLRALHLRDAELIGETPRHLIWKCYRESFIRRTAIRDGRILAMWGCSGSLLGGNGVAWLLAANRAESFIIPLVRVMRHEFASFLDIFPIVEMKANASNLSACNFIDHLGAKRREKSGPFVVYRIYGRDTYEVVNATQEHLADATPRLRAEDVAEATRFGRDIDETLAYTLGHSPYRKAWVVNGDVACLFGVGVTLGGKALPWLWATDLIELHMKEFVKTYLRIMKEAMAIFPRVEGIIAERYRPYLAWLEKHGVVVSPPFWDERAQTNFYRYEMRQDG